MTIFVPELADEDLTVQLDRTSGYITSVGGTIKEVLTDSPWGRRRLAYSIRFNSEDFRDGFYAVYHFDLHPAAMADVERELKLDTRVMRYLVVHDDPKVGEKNTGRTGEAAVADDAVVSAAANEDVPAATAVEPAAETPADAPAEPIEAAPAGPEAASVPVDAPAPADAVPAGDVAALEDNAPPAGETVSTESTADPVPATTEEADAP
ncbi:MAG TPA: 30S ribosomal protein S6, partial [Thermomicrobiales bacterium]|nr:30S ribosomal protein S6 [Thermomicrobiales bacterium]